MLTFGSNLTVGWLPGVESWQTWLGASSEGPGRSSAAGPPRKLTIGSNSTVGVLLGWNCARLDLERAPVASCLRPNAAAAPAISGLLELGSNSTSEVLLGSNCGTLDLAGAPEVSGWAVQQRRRPRMRTFGSNLTGGVRVGSNH